MSRTLLHKDKGKFNNKVLSFNETCESFQKHCHRANSEKSFFAKRRNKLRYDEKAS